MSNQQIENSFLKSKIKLRLSHLPAKNSINVLDMFSADGKIWDAIKQSMTEKKFNILRIEKKPDKKGIYLQGDNLKFLKSIDLQKFDIIDIDAFGVPYNQLKFIFQSGYKGIIFVTFIQSVFGCLPSKMLLDIGYTENMINKCPTLFYKNGDKKFFQWLALNGVKKISYMKSNKKIYLFFSTN